MWFLFIGALAASSACVVWPPIESHCLAFENDYQLYAKPIRYYNSTTKEERVRCGNTDTVELDVIRVANPCLGWPDRPGNLKCHNYESGRIAHTRTSTGVIGFTVPASCQCMEDADYAKALSEPCVGDSPVTTTTVAAKLKKRRLDSVKSQQEL